MFLGNMNHSENQYSFTIHAKPQINLHSKAMVHNVMDAVTS